MRFESASIEVERAVKIYRIGSTDVTALAGLDLRVEAGEMIGVIGPSGCGKSTLLNMIGALLTATSGKVKVGGVDLSELSAASLDEYRRTRVGFVWQETSRNLIPYLSALDNVLIPLRLAKIDDPVQQAKELLDLVGMGDRADHIPGQLSGGQQQRVSIAVALANGPSLLLADEPTGELDGETAEEVYALLRSVNSDLGITVVIVSHDPNMAQTVDRVVELRDGQSAMEHHAHRDADEDGIVLLVDTVGRIRMPDEFREELGIGERVQAELEEDRILLTPFELEGRQREDEQ